MTATEYPRTVYAVPNDVRDKYKQKAKSLRRKIADLAAPNTTEEV